MRDLTISPLLSDFQLEPFRVAYFTPLVKGKSLSTRLVIVLNVRVVFFFFQFKMATKLKGKLLKQDFNKVVLT